MALTSLILSILALITALGSLGWTIYSWHRSGANLEVKAVSFKTFGPPMGDMTFIAIDTTNVGRLSTHLTAVGFELPSGMVLMAPQQAIPAAPRLPAGLQPGESFPYVMSIEALRDQLAREALGINDLRPFAKCGHGTFYGKITSTARQVMGPE